MELYDNKVARFTDYIARHKNREEGMTGVIDILHGSAMELAFDDLKKGEVTRRGLETAKNLYAIRLASDTGLAGHF